MKKIAVFASGSGAIFSPSSMQTNATRYLRVALLVASKPGIGAIERAEKHGIAHIVRSKKDFADSETMYEDVIAELTRAESIISCSRAGSPS